MIELMSKYLGVFVVFKVFSHIAIESFRKDGVKTNYLHGSGIGGVFLFPIPKGANKYLNLWGYFANILFYSSLVIAVIESNF